MTSKETLVLFLLSLGTIAILIACLSGLDKRSMATVLVGNIIIVFLAWLNEHNQSQRDRSDSQVDPPNPFT